LPIDYSRGILNQLWVLKYTQEEYIQYINEPKHLINPVRDAKLFDSWYLEMLTKTPWFLVPIIWLPVAFYFLLQSENGIFNDLLMIGFGLGAWTLVEYVLHRFLFHGEDYWLPAGNVPSTIHFLVHGIHHAFPQDRYRLVFPPLPAYILFIFMVTPLCNMLIPT